MDGVRAGGGKGNMAVGEVSTHQPRCEDPAGEGCRCWASLELGRQL